VANSGKIIKATFTQQSIQDSVTHKLKTRGKNLLDMDAYPTSWRLKHQHLTS
jgi:hypothetical protein